MNIFENISALLYKLMFFFFIIAIIILIIILLFKGFKYLIKQRLLFNKHINIGKKTGIVFGKIFPSIYVTSKSDDEGSILSLGIPGSGKTRSCLIPSLNSWNGNFFCIDIAGDISANVRSENTILFDVDNLNTPPYSPFFIIDNIKDLDEKNEKLEQLAFLLIPEPVGSDNQNAKYFRDGGRKILCGALVAYYHKGLDFCEIAENIFSFDWKGLLNDIASLNNSQANFYIQNFQGANEQNSQGCKQVADEAVQLFVTNKKIKNAVRRGKNGEMFYTPILLEIMSVFIRIEEEKLNVYAPLLRMITAQTLEFFSSRKLNSESKTILLCLDEFARLGKLDITNSLRTLRKRKVRIFALTQSISDLDLIYGENERRVMLDTFAFKMVLSALDPKSCEEFAKMTGYKKSENSLNPLAVNDDSSYSFNRYNIEPSTFSKLNKTLIIFYPLGYARIFKNYKLN